MICRFLLAAEVTWEEPGRHADTTHDVAEHDLEEGQVAPGRDSGNRNHRERRRLGCDDGEHHRHPWHLVATEEIVGGVSTSSSEVGANTKHGPEIRRHDDDVESAHSCPRKENGLRLAQTEGRVGDGVNDSGAKGATAPTAA